MMFMQGVAGIIENYDGTFLLHLRDSKAPTMHDQWCLVGGTVEENEMPEQALKREVKEETDLDVQSLKPYTTFNFNDKTITIYYCEVDTRKGALKLGEGDDLRFIEQKKLMAMLQGLNYKNDYLEILMSYLLKI
jgi:8-oxo-dGTP diphosphatase